MIRLREATLDDLSTLLEFEQDLIAYERQFAPHLRKNKFHYYDLNAYIEDPNVCVVVAENNEGLLGSGYALIRENKPYKAPSLYVYLGFMYVIPAYRGQGINGKIMEYLIHWGKKEGYSEFQLEVFAENEQALKAYTKAGFVPEILTLRIDEIPHENR